MRELVRGSRVELHAFLGQLRGVITPELGDVNPPYTEKRPRRRHIRQHSQTRPLSAKLRLGLQLIFDRMERGF